MQTDTKTAVVIIGRNEGARLIRCLKSVCGQGHNVIYVDSGSTDGSVEAAKDLGAQVVALDLTQPFTAARARNAGFEAMMSNVSAEFVQFIDGDCELRDGWLDTALHFLKSEDQVAVAFGRRRERFPDASVYNRLCDWEWDTPLGEAHACGGDALMRVRAVQEVGGYNPDLIAGEEPDLCLRMREKGWKVWRLDHEMTWHDAAMTRFGQWWKRTRRAGHAFAEGAAIHGAGPTRHWVRETRKALLWGAALPLAILIAALVFGPWVLLGLAVYPAQVVRLAIREGNDKTGWERALFLVLGKFAEARGVLEYWLGRLLRRRGGLIEYK